MTICYHFIWPSSQDVLALTMCSYTEQIFSRIPRWHIFMKKIMFKAEKKIYMKWFQLDKDLSSPACKSNPINVNRKRLSLEIYCPITTWCTHILILRFDAFHRSLHQTEDTELDGLCCVNSWIPERFWIPCDPKIRNKNGKARNFCGLTGKHQSK